MRSIALVFAASLCACGSTGTTGSPLNDPPDASPPRGDADNGGDGDGGTVITPPQPPTFTITSPEISLKPGTDATYCYYFQTSNASSVSIQRWASHMTAGADQVIVYLTDGDRQSPSSLMTTQCGFTTGGTVDNPIWAYAATASEADAVMPSDDGTGVPLGQLVTGSQSGFLQMHFHNATSATISAHIAIDAYAYAPGTRVTAATAFVAFGNRINIGPGSATVPTTGAADGSCTLQSVGGQAPKFFLVNTQTHALGTRTSVKDGSTVVYDSAATPHVAAASWQPPTFYTFTSNVLTYHCEYSNTTGRTITVNDSSAADEVCVAVGYYFPAVSGMAHFCLDHGNALY